MNVSRILYPVEVLGPGKRIGIWLAGCEHRCKGCSNPELWKMRPEYEITVEELVTLIDSSFSNLPIDGFIITGGDPFYQSEELAELLMALSPMANDILVYTGFTYDELLSKKSASIDKCLEKIDVLIDGRYIEALNDGSTMRGSSNQKVIYLNPKLRPLYENYMKTYGNRIQNFSLLDGIISVGIHKKDFVTGLEAEIGKKGLKPRNV